MKSTIHNLDSGTEVEVEELQWEEAILDLKCEI